MDIGEAALHVRIDPKGAERGARRVNTALDSMRGKTAAVAKSTDLLRKALTYTGIALAVTQLGRLADSWTEVSNKLKIYTKSAIELKTIQDELFAISQRTRNDISATASLYSKLMLSQKSIGASQKDLLQFTENVGFAIKLSGANAQTASGALLQLGQALSTGRVYAEEMNSILEGTPRLAIAIADGIEEAGGNVGKLKSLVREGALTSQDLFAAVMSQTDKLQSEQQKITLKISDGFVMLDNAFKRFIGTMDQGLGASSMFAHMLAFLANNLSTVANAAVTAGVGFAGYFAAVRVGRLTAAVKSLFAMEYALGVTTKRGAAFGIAMKYATGGVRALTAAVAANPLGAIIVALTTTIGFLVMFGDNLKLSENSLASFSDYAIVAFGSVVGAIKDVILWIGRNFIRVWQGAFALASRLFVSFADSLSLVRKPIVWLVTSINKTFLTLVSSAKGAVGAFLAAWYTFPRALGDIVMRGVNGAIELVNKAIRKIASLLNYLPRISIDVDAIGFDKVTNKFEGSLKNSSRLITQAFADNYRTAEAGLIKLETSFAQGVHKIGDIGAAWKEAAENRARTNQEVFELGSGSDYGLQSVADAQAGKGKGKMTFSEYLGNMENEIELLKMTSAQRELLEAQIAAENDVKREGIKLTDDQNQKLLRTVKTRHLQKKATAATEQFMDAQVRLNNEVAEYNQLRNLSLISEETYQAALQDTYEKYDLVIGNIDSLRAKMTEGLDRWGAQLTDTLTDAAMTGKLTFQSLAESIIRDMVRMAIQAKITGPLLKMVSGAFGALGSVFGGSPNPATASAMTPATLGLRASGGPVHSGNWYVVGERGPELLRMSGSGGTVFSNRKSQELVSQGQSQSVNVVVSPVFNIESGMQDAAVTKDELAALVGSLPRMVRDSVMDGINKGGSFRRVIANA